MTPSPRTNSMSRSRDTLRTICSNVSSSVSIDVMVSVTSPRTMFICWSNACLGHATFMEEARGKQQKQNKKKQGRRHNRRKPSTTKSPVGVHKRASGA